MPNNAPKGKLIKTRHHCSPIDLTPPPSNPNQQSNTKLVTTTLDIQPNQRNQNSGPTPRKVEGYDNLSNNEKRWWSYTLGPGILKCIIKPRDVNAEDVLVYKSTRASYGGYLSHPNSTSNLTNYYRSSCTPDLPHRYRRPHVPHAAKDAANQFWKWKCQCHHL